MKIAVFGATGGVGRFVVKHALDCGHEVRAYVRNPDKLQMQHERLTVIRGELTDYAAIEKALAGCDAVISAIGIPLKLSYPSMDSLEGHRNIIKAMEALGIARLVDWSTPAVTSAKDKLRADHRASPHHDRDCSHDSQEGARRRGGRDPGKQPELDDRALRRAHGRTRYGQGECGVR